MGAGVENVNGIATLQGLEGIFENLIGALLFIAGIILFFMLITGGFKYITSSGDPKKLESARNTITYAVIGLVVAALSYIVLYMISQITGNKDILNFRIYIF